MKMKPEEIAAEIGERIAETEKVTAEDLEAAERALETYPDSVELWCLRGDLIQLSDEDNSYELKDAEASYIKAKELDPEDPEPYESLGFYFDAILGDPAKAEPYFRKAIKLGAGESAHQGLAEVLAQLRS
jgi:Flp pilus assembly protein TadD